jgi:hypothetical protein
MKFLFFALLLGVTGCAGSSTNADGGGGKDGGLSICPDHPSMCGGQCCGSQCVETTFDPRNCGQCGKTCVNGELCMGSACKCPSGGGAAAPCASSQACCPGTGCKNLTNDANNCGSCGVQCGPGGTCVNGLCGCGTMTCSSGQVCCNGTCQASCVTDMGTVTPDSGSGGLCQCADHCINDPIGWCLGTNCCYFDAFIGLCTPDSCTPNLMP